MEADGDVMLAAVLEESKVMCAVFIVSPRKQIPHLFLSGAIILKKVSNQ